MVLGVGEGCVFVTSDGFGLFHLPKKWEARFCLHCMEELVEVLRQDPALLTGTDGMGIRRCDSIAVL